MFQPEIRSSIKTLSPYIPGLSIAETRQKYNLSRIIKLASNENPLGVSPLVTDAIKRMAPYAFRYPQGGNPRLITALAEKYRIDPSGIAIGNGSDEIIDLLIRILAEPGRHNIVCFQPCFSIYPGQAQICGVECIRQPVEEDFSFDFQKLLNAVNENTRMVFITTPDNPSGHLPKLEDVRQFSVELSQKSPKALLVIDEAYMDFAPDEKASSLLYHLPLPANTAVIRTFSKSYGLAGLRAGYAFLPADIADAYWRARLPFSLNILAEEAALAALADTDFHELTIKSVHEGRKWLTRELKSLNCEVFNSAANFIMFSPPKHSSAQKCFQGLLEQGIIIRPLTSYGLADHLRVSIGQRHENQAFIEALAKITA